jgi:hypothetical protein
VLVLGDVSGDGCGGGSLLSPESSLTKICMVSSGSEEERGEVEEVGLEEGIVRELRGCEVVR